MVCIVSFKTKKDLKEAIENDKPVWIEDPSIVNPRTFAADEIKEGEGVVVTNHPKRSYFVSIKRIGGKLKVV
jgi:hypothetical protein